MRDPSPTWENLLQRAGPKGALLLEFKNPALKPLTGKTLDEVATMRGVSPEEAAMQLVVEDGSRVGTAYFLMSEDNVRREVALPWVSFGSDASAPAPEGVFLQSNEHPRAYGNFVRVLAKYVRDEKVISLQEAIRKLSALPAQNLSLKDRGMLRKGYFADVVIFDPRTVQDHATYETPPPALDRRGGGLDQRNRSLAQWQCHRAPKRTLCPRSRLDRLSRRRLSCHQPAMDLEQIADS